MRWRRISTKEPGFRYDVLVHRGVEVANVSTFHYGCYPWIMGERRGAWKHDIRAVKHRVRNIVQRKIASEKFGFAGFLAATNKSE